jgi:hypothetical protein
MRSSTFKICDHDESGLCGQAKIDENRLQGAFIMDRLENEDIGLIWARHFPKRANSDTSNSLCLTLAMILRGRAISPGMYGNWDRSLQQILTQAGIPREQFDTVESDAKQRAP